MSSLEDILKSRRDTRHFTTDKIPDEVIQKALQAGHWAPSVGLTDATRYYIIKSDTVKSAIKNLFLDYNKKAEELTDNPEQKELYKSLKLEAIEEAPIGLIIAYDRSVLNQFTIGTIGSNEAVKFSSVCAAQNIWLSLTEQGYGMGWVSILNYFLFKKILDLPENIEPLGYFCIGKPATNYGNQPMLQQLHWKQKSETADCKEINEIQPINISDFHLKTITKANPKTDFNTLLQEKIDSKTKPLGSLGTLETLAFQMASVFETLNPKIINPAIVVFAADHGIANHGVSDYPQDVTRQMVNNFLNGGAGINVFCKQNNIELSIVDSGVNYDFPTNSKLINAKIAKGTQSFLHAAAMSETELQLCFEKGKSIVENIAKTGSNCIGFGEMGIGNTSAASVLMSLLTGFSIEECVGKGTGINDQKLLEKQNILKKALENYSGQAELKQQIAYFGGFEIMQMASGMLTAFENKMLILVDGFICSVAFIIAFKINPNIMQNAVFCHCSAEKAHLKLLEYLDAKPILNLDLRLGEGTGCAVAFPILKSAEAFLNEMASFESAGISKK
ncbi:nicotinate-nucleotide--dimethylbenzimidazole phosphoribosyltransferase [Flavobacterium sp. HSC-32F16]|uniref:nicotinate-nucleotide--dimethylbenzimidazole phosphoribosyltransferase n=1 Tax=Flavobacterium sp. HSC-32F16 TaxID=2910964 RepID=UPI0020A324FE|nr:nicotinate-nucleotide--dimethylbenzimidazole phosphoribosyltransferase [Flavobacterium sp. HSC-32F16]MCP2029431.1 nicotinate-nucleotide--dimethylbenzimidazole phosphoribosyltransferase [Flavobacterium sp. HSC-32F16]